MQGVLWTEHRYRRDRGTHRHMFVWSKLFPGENFPAYSGSVDGIVGGICRG